MTTSLTPNAQRILGIIYAFTLQSKVSCIEAWRICDELDVDRSQLRCMIPGTEYDEALKELIDANLIEETPNLGLRYQLKKEQ